MREFIRTKFLLPLILLGFLRFIGYSQTHLTHHYTENNGLCSSFVNDIIQDKDGSMWFACRTGLSRFNGFDWTPYYYSKKLKNVEINKLTDDSDKGLWSVATHPFLYVSHFSNNKWEDFHPLDTCLNLISILSFEVIVKNRDTLCFVGTAQRGLYFYSGNNWHLLPPKIAGHTIFAIEESSIGILVASSKGLFIFNNGNLSEISIRPKVSNLYGLTVEDPGKLKEKIWLVDQDVIWQYKNGILKKVINHNIHLENAQLAEPDQSGGLYFGDAGYCWHFSSQNNQVLLLERKNGYISEGTSALFCDKEKNLWHGTHRGVSKKPINLFTNYNSLNGLTENEVTAIDEYQPGKYIFGHNHGITIWDGNNRKNIQFPLTHVLSNIRRVLDIAHDSLGTIYIACSTLGLGIIENGISDIVWVGVQNDITKRMTSVVIDSKGTIWVANATTLFTLVDNKLIPHVLNKKLNGITYRKIFINKQDELIITTFSSGTYKFGPNGLQHFYLDNNPKANNCFSYHHFDDNRELIGTLDGIYEISNDTIKKYLHIESLASRPVYFLQEHERVMWIGSDNGVYSWNGKLLLHHDVRNGFSGIESNRSACIIDSKGDLWIGSDKGLSKLNKDFLYEDVINVPPSPTITQICSTTDTLPLNRNSRIPNSSNDLSFSYRHGSLAYERETFYSVKLEGFDTDWSQPLPTPMAHQTYSRLPSGTYRFLIKTRNAFGVWSAPSISPYLTINKPFYFAWWFLLLVASLIFLVARWFYYYYSNRIWTIRLEELVNEKTKELELSEKRYRQMIGNSNAIILIAEANDLKIIHCNQTAVKYIGYSEDILKEFRISQLLKGEGIFNKIQDLRQKPSGYFTALIELENRQTKHVEIYYSRLDSYDYQGYFLILHDITKRIEFEEKLKASNLEKDQFLSIISHDLKSPFSSILGFSEILVEDYHNMDDASRLESIVTLRHSAESTYQLLENLLQWALNETGRLQFVPTKIDLLELVQKNIDIAMPRLQSKNISCSVSQSDPIYLMADANMIDTILRNLLSNALKFTNTDGTINIKLIETSDHVNFTISDTGIGMSKDQIESLLSRKNTTSTLGINNEKGTGLGMKLCSDFVEKHNGSISITSQIDKGTNIEIILPK